MEMLSERNSRGDIGNDALANAIGKTISAIGLYSIEDNVLGVINELHIEFVNGIKIKLMDVGQSCCERRYMRTDDNLEDYIGARFIGVEIKEAPEMIDEYCNVHEVQFLEIKTDRGALTMANHNEHNGYYGGFKIFVGAA